MNEEIKQWLLLDLSSSQVSLVRKGPCCWQELGSFECFLLSEFLQKMKTNCFSIAKNVENLAGWEGEQKLENLPPKLEFFHVLHLGLIQNSFGVKVFAK